MFLNTFDEVLASDVPVLVDFYAPWCPPCHSMMPTIDKIAQEFPVFKVNTEEDMELASLYNISALPTLMIFKNGRLLAKDVGAKSEKILRDALKEAADR